MLGVDCRCLRAILNAQSVVVYVVVATVCRAVEGVIRTTVSAHQNARSKVVAFSFADLRRC